jgi:hypothetical protein
MGGQVAHPVAAPDRPRKGSRECCWGRARGIPSATHAHEPWQWTEHRHAWPPLQGLRATYPDPIVSDTTTSASSRSHLPDPALVRVVSGSVDYPALMGHSISMWFPLVISLASSGFAQSDPFEARRSRGGIELYFQRQHFVLDPIGVDEQVGVRLGKPHTNAIRQVKLRLFPHLV